MQAMLKKAEIAVYRLLKEDGHQSQMNDIVEYIICIVICLNVVLIIFESMKINGRIGLITDALRICFFIFFLTEYILRLWIADIVMQDKKHPIKSRIRYMLSIRAIIDLLALLPVMLGGTVIDFRVFRILRLLKVTQLTSLKQYTDTLTEVIKLKGSQLLASLFIVLIFLLFCAVIIYDLEYNAQPDVFSNILASLWWTISAVTTVGYGDMYPVTTMGKILGSFISIFGVFLMAIPVGILTTGFFEVAKNAKSNEKIK